jgi:hypothetical protein
MRYLRCFILACGEGIPSFITDTYFMDVSFPAFPTTSGTWFRNHTFLIHEVLLTHVLKGRVDRRCLSIGETQPEFMVKLLSSRLQASLAEEKSSSISVAHIGRQV